jgi:hypothetical protein
MTANTTDNRNDSGSPPRPRRSPFANRTVLGLLRSPARSLMQAKLAAIRYEAVITRKPIEFPVQYARSGGAVVVIAANPDSKSWWRHFTFPSPAQLLLDGHWHNGVGRTLKGPERTAALDDYYTTYPGSRVSDEVPVVAFEMESYVGRANSSISDLTRSWIPSVTIAEFVGFTVPATAGIATASSSATVALPAVIAAGAVEGALLGWGQVRVLRRALPTISRTRWIAATSFAAALAYLLGMGPSTWVSPVTTWPPVAVVGTMSLLGIAVLFSIGTAQWLVLRTHVPNATPWISITALAWFLGLAVFLCFAMPLWHEGQSPAWGITIGVIGGFLMAATSSVLTGFGLRLVLPELRSQE